MVQERPLQTISTFVDCQICYVCMYTPMTKDAMLSAVFKHKRMTSFQPGFTLAMLYYNVGSYSDSGTSTAET